MNSITLQKDSFISKYEDNIISQKGKLLYIVPQRLVYLFTIKLAILVARESESKGTVTLQDCVRFL